MINEEDEDFTEPKRKRTKKGKGGKPRKKTKLTSKYPNDPDAEGYEVRILHSSDLILF